LEKYFLPLPALIRRQQDENTAVLGFAIFFSFVVLAVQFNSLKMPLLILGSVPFCVAGMAYALHLTGLPMGATVLIGLLVVVASTVNEGVLLLTYTEELRSEHRLSAFEAIVQAAKIRFRPRMMISLCVIAGLIPLALNIEEGGDMLQPMAVAAIGGLGLGIFVALFLVPCLYVIFDWKKATASGSLCMTKKNPAMPRLRQCQRQIRHNKIRKD